MGIGCQRNGHTQRPIICQVVACAANQRVVVCGRAVCQKGCAYIRQLANSYHGNAQLLGLPTMVGRSYVRLLNFMSADL